jgi:hypothetical protein
MPNTTAVSGTITAQPQEKKVNTQAFGTYASSKGRSRKNGGSRKRRLTKKKNTKRHRK